MSRKKANKREISGRLPKKNEDSRGIVTDWYLFLMLPVYCLWCPDGFANLEYPKFVFFAGVTLLWFIMLIIFSFGEGRPAGFFTPARISALVFALVCLLSALFSPFGLSKTFIGHRYTGLLTQLLLAMILIGVSCFGRCRDRHFIAFGAGITLLCLVCILQKLGLNVFGFYPDGNTYYDNLAFLGTIGNVDTMAAIVALATPLFLGLFVKREAPWDKLYLVALFSSSMVLTLGGAESGLLGVASVSVVAPAFLVRSMKDLRRTLSGAALMLAGLALGNTMSYTVNDGVRSLHFRFGTLTALCLALAAVLVTVSWLLRFVRREPSGRMFRNAFIIAAVVCVLGALTVIRFWPGESGSIYEASQILRGHFEDSYGADRVGIWRVTLTNVPDRPLLGGGPGTLHLRTVRIFTETDGASANLAHNVYLQYLVDTGFLGLLSYLAVIVTSIFVRRRERWDGVCAGLVLAALSFAVQDFFNLGVPVASPYFWIVLGLLQTGEDEKPDAARKQKAAAASVPE